MARLPLHPRHQIDASTADIGPALGAWVRGWRPDRVARDIGPLLVVLRRRLRRFPEARLQRRKAAGDAMAGALPTTVYRPGCRLPSTHWRFPVVTDEPQTLVDGLLAQGFDVTQGTSQIGVADPPVDRPGLNPHHARALMAGTVFLPAYPEMPAAERRRLVEAVAQLHR